MDFLKTGSADLLKINHGISRSRAYALLREFSSNLLVRVFIFGKRYKGYICSLSHRLFTGFVDDIGQASQGGGTREGREGVGRQLCFNSHDFLRHEVEEGFREMVNVQCLCFVDESERGMGIRRVSERKIREWKMRARVSESGLVRRTRGEGGKGLFLDRRKSTLTLSSK